jgi:hypothetical protein
VAVESIAEIRTRLGLLFPEGVPARNFLTRELAAKTIATFLFLDAVGDPEREGVRLLRPSMVAWLDDVSLSRSADERFVRGWHDAATRGQARLRAFLDAHAIEWRRWYADNSRESIRDEVIRPLQESYGAVRRRAGVAATGGSPTLTLAQDFATVFEAGIDRSEADRRIAAWQADHLGATAQARLAALRRLDAADVVTVELPGRGPRQLPPGTASRVTQAVIEVLAPQLLRQPFVLAVCHSRDPVAVEDARELERVGLALDANLALPDVLLLDAADGTLWFVEVVATAGEISERRRVELEAWAAGRGIASDRCRFVTAYRSRADQAFRRTAGDLAWGTYAWFADEPHGIWHLATLATLDDPPAL